MRVRYRVMRVAPSAVSPPCGCSHDEPVVVWEGDRPSDYHGGLGAFDEGCHHPSRWMVSFVELDASDEARLRRDAEQCAACGLQADGPCDELCQG